MQTEHERLVSNFTMYEQEKIGMDIMHSILFEGKYRVTDPQEDETHIYDIKFSPILKQFEVYKAYREREKWVLVFESRSYATIALAIWLKMKAFRNLDLAKICDIHEAGGGLPQVDQLPRLGV